jgi:hypothetical protein
MSDQEKEEGLTTGGLKTGSLSDRSENSNIKQAAPMSGLQTGSLRDHIAEQYEPALSGSEGPRARFDTLRELINTEIGSYESGKVVSSTGSDSLTGFGQFKTLRISRGGGRAATIPEVINPVYGPWGLVPFEDDGEYGINLGVIFKSFGSIAGSNKFTIEDPETTFTPSASTLVYLELDNTSTPTITLKAGAAWEEHPSTFKLATTGVIKAEKAYFCLWQGVEGQQPVGAAGVQFTGFWMHQMARSNYLILGYGSYELDDTHRHIAVPVLFPM